MNSVCMRRPAESSGIIEAARQRDALGRRQLLENLGLLFLRQVLEDATASSDSISRTPSATVCGGSSSRISSRTASSTSVSAVKSKSDAEQFDQARPQIGIERLEQGAEIGFVQVADQRAQGRRYRRPRSPGRPARRIRLADRAVVVARQRRASVLFGMFLFEPCRASRGKTLKAARACTPGSAGRAND